MQRTRRDDDEQVTAGRERPRAPEAAPLPPLRHGDMDGLLRTLATAPAQARAHRLSGQGNAALAQAIAARERAAAPAPGHPHEGSTTVQIPFTAVIRKGPATDSGVVGAVAAGAFGDAPKGAEHGHTASEAAAATGVPAEAAAATEAGGAEGAPPQPAAASASTSAPGETGAAPAQQAEEVVSLPDIKLTGVEQFSLCDAIWTWLGYSGTVVHGGVANPGAAFGVTVPGNITLANITVRHGFGQFLVSATLNQQVDWQVHNGVGPNGEVSVGSSLDPVITAANHQTVASDLTPNMADLGGRPPRTQFWAQDLTERHEKYHADDAVGRGPAALRVASAWLRTQQAPDVPGVQTLLNQVPGRAFTALMAAMAYPAREERAYGDGAMAYSLRANAIKALGAIGWYR